MRPYSFPYGSGQVKLELDESQVLSVLKGHPTPPVRDIAAALTEALGHVPSVVCAAAAFFTYKGLSLFWQSRITVIIAILVAAAVYVVVILFTHSITKEDMAIVPKGDKIYAKLHAKGLMK